MSPEVIAVGYSPCPNDTFIFHALVSGLVSMPDVTWSPRLEDVETLNRLAFERAIPVTKISFHAFGRLRESHVLLSAGSAIGRGCGPLLVAKDSLLLARIESARIAIPGKWTSAALLLKLFAPRLREAQLVEMPFHRILESAATGEVDAGLIIHESRFTYAGHGLAALVDLGEWWEKESGHPIPLGGIIADRRLGEMRIGVIQSALRESVRHARRHPEDSREYVRAHAQELSADVIRAHINLYVNDLTEDLGARGVKAVEVLLKTAEDRGVLPRYPGELVVAG